jgi:hypothetical protein
MAKNRNFNNNINKENNNNFNGMDATNYIDKNDVIDIEKEIPQTIDDKIDIPEIKIEPKKEYIKPVFKPLPQNKVYFGNPDINLIITCYVKYGKDLNTFKMECAKLGYIDLLFKETEKNISFMWNGNRFEYEKSNL